jgi:hypothetical protein
VNGRAVLINNQYLQECSKITDIQPDFATEANTGKVKAFSFLRLG